MSKWRSGFLGALITLFFFLQGCSGSQPRGTEGTSLSAEAQAMLQQHAKSLMRMRPVRATQLGLYDEDLDLRLADAMDDYSVGQMREWRSAIRSMRQQLASLSEDAIDPMTRAAIEEIYTVYRGAEDIPFGYIDQAGRHRPYVINQIEHPLQYVPYVMTKFQRVDTAEDAADYLRRLWALSSLVDSVLGKFNFDADAGWLPPRPVLAGGLQTIETFLAPPIDEHPLVTTFLAKVDQVAGLDAVQRTQIRNEALAVMERVVYPAYRNAMQAVKLRLPQTRDAAGLWAKPLGPDFYRVSIQTEALSELSAGAIHRIGLDEVARIETEMDVKLKSLGLSGGSVAARMLQLAADPVYRFSDTEEGRRAMLAKTADTVDEMQKRLPEYFGRLPSQSVEVQRLPPEIEQGSALGTYYGPPLSGKGTGLFLLNMRSMDELPWFGMPTLIYHETIPGHHLQIALARGKKGRPLIWRQALNSGFSEGWALYAEKLAAEMGVYEDDVAADLGRLQDELQRAVRLVVDTGIHDQRWTLDQAMSYYRDTLGSGPRETRAEVLRYVAWPGQALSYKLGMLGLLEAREEAQQALGNSFDLREFHDRVLNAGPVSISLLKRSLQDWYDTH